MNKKEVEVFAAVIHKGDLFYVVQRPFKGEVGGMWEFPGGKIERNESKEQALIREINEEIKIKVKIEKFIKSTSFEYKTFKINLHFFLCSILEGEPFLTEHINQAWVTRKNLIKIDLAEADIEVIDSI
jgi:8-oxo-dGTP diphosphatase